MTKFQHIEENSRAITWMSKRLTSLHLTLKEEERSWLWLHSCFVRALV